MKVSHTVPLSGGASPYRLLYGVPPRPGGGGGGNHPHLEQDWLLCCFLWAIKAITMLSLHKYSPFNKDITTLLSCQYVGFLEWHVFSVPDDNPQLVTKVNMNLKNSEI